MRLFDLTADRPTLAVLLLSILCIVVFMPGLGSVPPLDRDESRFAQASKQMVESGDIVRIRFQDTDRNKKPAGAYWAQAASAAVFGAADRSSIWAYRVPSALAAWLGVLLIFALGRVWIGPALGFLAAALSAVAPMLVLEAHQAKADALLFLTIVAAQGALGLLYVHARDGAFSRLSQAQVTTAAFAFWIAQGLAILVKGPIGPMISALTIIALVLADRERAWLRVLRARAGAAVAIVIAAPWFIAITVATDGGFLADALGKDLFAKVASGQESHGAPPGYYTVLVHLTFWPAACVLIPAVIHAWRNRSEAWIRFALAWVVPAWLVFEAVPTKLPHYVLPLYPALALIVARYAGDVTQGAARLARRWRPYAIGVAALTPAVLAGAALYAPVHFQTPEMGADTWIAAVCVVGLAALSGGLAAAALIAGEVVRGLRLCIATGAVVLAVVLAGVMPRLDGMWIGRAIVEAVHMDATGPAPLAATGFHEPSLVFLAGTGTRLVNDGASAAAWLLQTPDGYAAVAAEHDAAFQSSLQGAAITGIAEITGVNYSRGDAMRLTLYRHAR